MFDGHKTFKEENSNRPNVSTENDAEQASTLSYCTKLTRHTSLISDPDVRTEKEKRREGWLYGQALPWESARSLNSVFMSVLSRRKERKMIIKRRLNAPLIRLWMRAARCSSSFMLCRFHGGINTTLSQHPAPNTQHPAQPHPPCCTASTKDYLILCLLTHFKPPGNNYGERREGFQVM